MDITFAPNLSNTFGATSKAAPLAQSSIIFWSRASRARLGPHRRRDSEVHIGEGYLDGTGKPQKFIGADLVAGESVVHRGVGTFTLLTVDRGLHHRAGTIGHRGPARGL